VIVVKVELWPGGDEGRKRSLGEARISNDATESLTTELRGGSYDVVLLTGDPPLSKKAGKEWRRGRVTGFPRIKLGPWDLLYRALRATVGSRNP
jgi:hypothetical protein